MQERALSVKIDALPRYTQKQVASLLGVGMSTLRTWRLARQGPPYRKQVGRIVYDAADVAEWLEKTRWG